MPGRRGSAGQSALREYRRQRRRAWLPWRLAAVAAAAFAAGVAVDRAAPPGAAVVAVALAVALVPWFQATARRSEALAGSWRQGAEGELLTRRLLRRLERRGWRVFHDLAVPPGPRSRRRSSANIDHLVVGPGGIFLIDSKNYESWVYWVDEDGWWNKGRPLEPRFEATRFEASRVTELLVDVLGLVEEGPGDGAVGVLDVPHLDGDHNLGMAGAAVDQVAEPLEPVEVEPMWCVHGVDVLPDRWVWADEDEDLLLVSAPWLVRVLRRRPSVLPPDRVAAIAQAIQDRLSPAR
jgi:hypothetical protein